LYKNSPGNLCVISCGQKEELEIGRKWAGNITVLHDRISKKEYLSYLST
jgi:hypothetical protein